MTNYGVLGGSGLGTGIAPLRPTPARTTPGTPPLPVLTREWPGQPYTRYNIAVGLKSVAQLTLGTHFSGFQGITEGYNLVYTGNADDHKSIPGNK